MQHFIWKTLLLALLLSACQQEQKHDNQLVVSANEVSLRAEPNEKSEAIEQLSKGDLLTDLLEVSSFETQVTTGKYIYQTPWISVRTRNEKTGWALAWGLRPVNKQEDWLLQKRMLCYFGKRLTTQRNALIDAEKVLENEAQMQALWQAATVLRDSAQLLLSGRAESGFEPDLGWLNALIPGFILQQNRSGAQARLFADFKFWSRKSLKTSGVQDDIFFKTMLTAFPADSIESDFPVWTFQWSETAAASQLGTGQHLKLFEQIDNALEAGSLFKMPLVSLKNQLLEDIFDQKVQYWQPADKILKELDLLLKVRPACLSPDELEALQIRRKMFENPEANGLIINKRSGE